MNALFSKKSHLLVLSISSILLFLDSRCDAVEWRVLYASNGNTSAEFGHSASIASNGFAVVGAYREGTQGTDAGAAYIFERDLGGFDNWGQRKILYASNANASIEAGFGYAVSISSNGIALVGARREDTQGTDAGAAYIFERDLDGQDNWGERKILYASNPNASSAPRFGRSASVSSTGHAIIGAHLEDTKGPDAGAAYIFERDLGSPDNWGERKILYASNANASTGARFGRSVSISSTGHAIVGAYEEDTQNTDAGAAYIFERDLDGPDNWGERTILYASNANASNSSGFGWSVTISSDGIAVVGAYQEDTRGADAGAAYVFERDLGGPDNWGERAILYASNANASSVPRFGNSVSISSTGRVIVGADLEDTRGTDAGAVYVFERDLGGIDNWGESMILYANTTDTPRFGRSVALSSTGLALVGAPLEDTQGGAAGAAQLFLLTPCVGDYESIGLVCVNGDWVGDIDETDLDVGNTTLIITGNVTLGTLTIVVADGASGLLTVIGCVEIDNITVVVDDTIPVDSSLSVPLVEYVCGTPDPIVTVELSQDLDDCETETDEVSNDGSTISVLISLSDSECSSDNGGNSVVGQWIGIASGTVCICVCCLCVCVVVVVSSFLSGALLLLLRPLFLSSRLNGLDSVNFGEENSTRSLSSCSSGSYDEDNYGNMTI